MCVAKIGGGCCYCCGVYLCLLIFINVSVVAGDIVFYVVIVVVAWKVHMKTKHLM